MTEHCKIKSSQRPEWKPLDYMQNDVIMINLTRCTMLQATKHNNDYATLKSVKTVHFNTLEVHYNIYSNESFTAFYLTDFIGERNIMTLF